MTWLGYEGDDVTELCFKQQHMSMQKDIKIHGHKVKDSEMKEMKNLTLKKNCFGDIECGSMIQETQDKALPLLMFMIMKRSSELNTRGVANGSM